ncbi:hypothetical protein MMAGJ_75850 [Mycolicibacterium mageritense]|uniref:Uncharacterized protein n=1 Tax=Mycolicibacterium mageritense TaxID=53462 RepID=A0ABM7I5V3_MYCME|nr:hypothetical protein MMAGJ_75850 [Mycolicibacterium mageritense]GJJ22645.1 hypothetical protein MTY414_63180 [Mycolicibacterium mageritense]
MGGLAQARPEPLGSRIRITEIENRKHASEATDASSRQTTVESACADLWASAVSEHIIEAWHTWHH